MRKIFTRYVFLLQVLLFSGMPVVSLAGDVVYPVIIDENFSSFVYKFHSKGDGESWNGWTGYYCICLSNSVYDNSIQVEKYGYNKGYLISPNFNVACDALLTFSYANTNNQDNKSSFSVRVIGGGHFENGDAIINYPEITTAKTVFSVERLKILDTTADTQIRFDLSSDYSFAVDDVKITAAISESDGPKVFGAQTCDLLLVRSLQPNIWNTLCLPFAVTTNMLKSQLGSSLDIKLRTFTSYSDNIIRFSEVDAIEAGVPFLIKVDTEVADPTFKNVSLTNVAAQTVTDNGVSMVGSYAKTTLTADAGKQAVFLTADGKLKKAAAGHAEMKGLRAFFILPEGAASRVAIEGDDVTAIREVGQQPQSTVDGYHSLTGLRYDDQPRQRGIYVKDGQKIFIK